MLALTVEHLLCFPLICVKQLLDVRVLRSSMEVGYTPLCLQSSALCLPSLVLHLCLHPLHLCLHLPLHLCLHPLHLCLHLRDLSFGDFLLLHQAVLGRGPYEGREWCRHLGPGGCRRGHPVLLQRCFEFLAHGYTHSCLLTIKEILGLVPSRSHTCTMPTRGSPAGR